MRPISLLQNTLPAVGKALNKWRFEISLLFIVTFGFATLTALVGRSSLKDWQPLMAATIALVGGSLAYRGAMAKIDADKEKDHRDLERRKLGIYLRLRFACEGIASDAENGLRLTENKPLETNYRKISVNHLRFKDRSLEIGEAWNNLDLLPLEVSLRIEKIRTQLPQIDAHLDSYPNGLAERSPFLTSMDVLNFYIVAAEGVLDWAKQAAADLDREILAMRII